MTNPAWVVLFTKITRPRHRGRRHGRRTRPSSRASSGSRPSSAPPTPGERIKTGDRIRVNGTTGVVEILA